ncbi:MAG: hypothetical protein QF926_10640 [Alphaproteobacteria bacterium]|nr:hypothetical protein [Alphaproteobacteria bacterium]
MLPVDDLDDHLGGRRVAVKDIGEHDPLAGFEANHLGRRDRIFDNGLARGGVYNLSDNHVVLACMMPSLPE